MVRRLSGVHCSGKSSGGYSRPLASDYTTGETTNVVMSQLALIFVQTLTEVDKRECCFGVDTFWLVNRTLITSEDASYLGECREHFQVARLGRLWICGRVLIWVCRIGLGVVHHLLQHLDGVADHRCVGRTD